MFHCAHDLFDVANVLWAILFGFRHNKTAYKLICLINQEDSPHRISFLGGRDDEAEEDGGRKEKFSRSAAPAAACFQFFSTFLAFHLGHNYN